MIEAPVRQAVIDVTADKLLPIFRQLVQESDVCRIMIKDEEGRVLMDFPLTFGIVGVALFPPLATVSAFAALADRFTIVVERIK